MKRGLITAICWTLLINAMDYQSRILQINGRIYRGYYLHENESPVFSCVGIRQDTSFNFLTQNQDTYTEIAAQGRYYPEYYALCRLPSNSSVALYEDPYILRCFFLSGPSDSATKALALFHLYTSIQVKRSLAIENSSILTEEFKE